MTLQTVEAIVASDFQMPFTYTVYNDFSTEENTAKLQDASEKLGFELVNLAEITDHPSPNYLLVLQMAQQRAIEAEAGLIIVESDVVVKKNTLQALFNGAAERADCGIAAAVTVDEKGEINYPYLFAKGKEKPGVSGEKALQFLLFLADIEFPESIRLPSVES